MKIRVRRQTALYFAFLTLGCGFLVPNVPAFTSHLAVTGSEVSLAAAALIATGILLSSYSAIAAVHRRRIDEPVNVEEVIHDLRSFEQHQQARREEKARTLYYDEFRIPSAISAGALRARFRMRRATDADNSGNGLSPSYRRPVAETAQN